MLVPFSALDQRHRKNKRRFIHQFKKSIYESEFILGSAAENFEKDFASFVGSKFALGVGNGSDALRLALIVKDLPKDSNILIAANTYFAAAAAIVHAGMVPKFFDVELETRFPNSKQIESYIDSNTSAIIRSHLFGEVDNCEVNNLIEIHDCSQAHGTLLDNTHVGSGELSTFSFYPGKNLGAFGDAGIITTNSESEYESLKMYRNQGTNIDRYLHEVVGFNSRLDSIQANILRIKLTNLNRENEKRRNLANIYFANLNNKSGRIKLFHSNLNSYSTYHLFQIYLPENNVSKVQSELLRFGISTGRHYPIPLHLQPAFKNLGYQKGDFPNAELLANNSLSLPLYPEMTNTQVNYVCEKILEILK